MRCSTWRRLVDEPAIGTAAAARAWVALEQPGPWGAKAPTQSRLDPELGKSLEKRSKAAGARLALLRHPAGSTDRYATQRQVFAACSLPGRTFLLGGTVEDPAALLDLDVEALVDGDVDAVRTSLPALVEHTAPVLLVCVNGKRDACCALLGLPTAYTLHDEFGEAVWETNHLGGHRFAPTTVTLPYGYSHAGVDPLRGQAIMRAAEGGRLVPDGLRGRSAWHSPVQAAELAARRAADEWRLDAIAVESTERTAKYAWTVRLTVGEHPIEVAASSHPADQRRPESCGKDDKPVYVWHTQVLSDGIGAEPATGREAHRDLG